MQLNAENGMESLCPVWLAVREIKDGFNNNCCSLPRLTDAARNLERTLEYTRQIYNNALKQRDEAHAKLTALQKPLGEVERVVSQYASVSEPVVASDGFTYENVSILEYIKECARTNTKAYSQLTKEELRDVVVPNQTLNRLVGILQKVHPPEMPQISQRFPIQSLFTQQGDINARGASYNSNTNGNVDLKSTENDASCGATPICVAELEATLVNAAHFGSLNVSESSNNAAIANSTQANSGATHGRRWEARQQQQQQSAGHGGKSNRKHPCLRVYGRCNFLNDCAFANYPYEACLNHIKGKCRFGRSCKEMHVNPTDLRYVAHRKSGATNNNGSATLASTQKEEKSSGTVRRGAKEKDEKKKEKEKKEKEKEKENSGGGSDKGETNSKEGAEEQRGARPKQEEEPQPQETAQGGTTGAS